MERLLYDTALLVFNLGDNRRDFEMRCINCDKLLVEQVEKDNHLCEDCILEAMQDDVSTVDEY
jgi:rRNA maturation endonuclease Nob1